MDVTGLGNELMLSALLNQLVEPKQLQQRARREIHLYFEDVDEQAWILAGDERIGRIDRKTTTLEWLTPNPGRAAHETGYSIVLKWVIGSTGADLSSDEPAPAKLGLIGDTSQSFDAIGEKTGLELFFCIDHKFTDEQVAGSHEVSIGYDPVADSYFADVRAARRMTTPSCACFGVLTGDDRYIDTIWQHPDGTTIRHLAEKNNSSLYPQNAQTRAQVNQRMDFASIHISTAGARIFWNTPGVKFATEEPDLNSLATGRSFLERFLPAIDGALAGGANMGGGAPTIADIAVLSMLDPAEVLAGDLSVYGDISRWRNSLRQEAFYQVDCSFGKKMIADLMVL